MTNDPDPRLRVDPQASFGGHRLRRVALAVFGIGALLFTLIVLGYNLSNQIDELQSEPGDNAQWVLSQIEVELGRFEAVLVEATLSPRPLLESVRQRFDIFYSRVEVLESGRLGQVLRALEGTEPTLDELNAFLARHVDAIDGPDGALYTRIPTMREDLSALRPTVRALALDGITHFALLAEARRKEIYDQTILTGAVAGFLIIALMSAITILTRQMARVAAQDAEIRQTERLMSSTVASSIDPIIVADEAGRVVSFNDAATQVFGYTPEEIIGRPMEQSIVPLHHREAHKAGMTRLLKTGQRHLVDQGRKEMTALRKSGEEFPIEISITAVERQSSTIFIAYVRDISERVAAARVLTTARDAAREADRAKSKFLAIMSHEMRTPLNGILGMLDLLRGTGLTTKQSEYVKAATRSGEVLLHHVGDVLDLTQVQDGRMKLASKGFNLTVLLKDVVFENRGAAEGRNNTLTADIAEDVPDRMIGDPNRIRQVLSNLVSNAIKFTEHGSIAITVEVQTRTEERVTLCFDVTDDGIGIPEDHQRRVFDEFVTLDAGFDRKSGGTGLGLAICRQLVSLMGGKIAVESFPGSGSRFYFTTPLRIETATTQKPRSDTPPPEVTGAFRVLVVEDNETNRLVLHEMLEAIGVQHEEAVDGAQGVRKSAESAYDLILMDVSMPNMDGIEATRRIRNGSGPNAGTRIIGLTAHAGPETQHKLFEAGMDSCVVKPIRYDRLSAVINDVASSAPPVGLSAGPIDIEQFFELREQVGDGVIGDVVARFLDELSQFMEELEEMDAVDEERWATSAHRLAGSAAVFGATKLQGVLARLETAGSFDGMTAVRPEVTDAAQETSVALADISGLTKV
ncbi:MAG: ATP-binding protein [Pseudomonadota bacterium]